MTDIIEVIDDGTIVAVVEQAATVVIEVPQDDAPTVVEIHVQGPQGPQGPGTSVDLSSPGPIGDDTPDTIRSTAIEIVATETTVVHHTGGQGPAAGLTPFAFAGENGDGFLQVDLDVGQGGGSFTPENPWHIGDIDVRVLATVPEGAELRFSISYSSGNSVVLSGDGNGTYTGVFNNPDLTTENDAFIGAYGNEGSVIITDVEVTGTAPSSVVLTLGDVEVKASVESASIGIGMDPVDDVTVAVDSLHVTALTIGDDARLPVTATSYDPDTYGGMFTLSSASYGDLAIGPSGVEVRHHNQGAGYTGTYFSSTRSYGVRASWALRNDGDTFDAYSAYSNVSRGYVRASFASRADDANYDRRSATIEGNPDGGVLQFTRHVISSGPENRSRSLTVRAVDEFVDALGTLLLPFPAEDPFIETVATREWVESKYDPIVVATPSSSAGVLTLDFAGKSRAVFAVTLTENVTSVVHTNIPTGVFLEYEIHYTQGGAGGFTVAQPASHKALGGSDTVVSTTVGKVTVQSAASVDGGTTWRYAMQESG